MAMDLQGTKGEGMGAIATLQKMLLLFCLAGVRTVTGCVVLLISSSKLK